MAIEERQQSQLSNVGNVLIQTLIERKEKEDFADKILSRWSTTTIISLLLATLYMFLNYYQSISFLTVLSGDFFMFIMIGMFAVCVLQVKFAKKKLDKAEEEYDKLRCEIIERAEELWNTEELWKERDRVYEQLMKEHDVNLYHK